MARPTDSVVTWATADVDTDNGQLKIAPPAEIQASGLLKSEPMGRQWFNYIINNFSTYIKYLDETINPSTATPATHEIKISATPRADLTSRGWKLIKTLDDTATSSGKMYYYEHIGA